MAHLAALVDDEPWTMIDAERSVDWERFGFKLVRHYTSPVEALQEIPLVNYSLIMVDIRMPGMDGLELISRLRKKHVPAHFAILSGYSDFEYARSALRLGAEEYFSKPLDPEEIHSYLAKLAPAYDTEALSMQEVLFRQILDYIRLNLYSRIRLEDIADRFGYNKNYISQLFTKKLGVCFSTYVTQARIESAKRLLGGSPLSIAEIAERCGFTDEMYFHRIFKRETGMTPTEYRKQCLPEDKKS